MFTTYKRIISFVVVLVLIVMIYGGLNAAPVGQGSYTTTLPAGETGPTNSAGASVSPKVVSGFSGPVQTNDWWSSLIWQHDPANPYSNNMFPHPLALRAFNNGLGLSYPTYVALNNEYHRHYQPEDIRIGLVGLNAPDTRVADYSDWTVTARWTNGSNNLDATFGHGLPFVYLSKSGGNAQISVTTGYQGTWHNSGGVLGIQANGHYYAIFAPAGSTWTGSNPFQSSLNGQDYFSVAVLPDNSASTLEFYRQHAYAFVTDTQVGWTYDEATANLQTTYTVSTELKESGNGNVNRPLLALYRHQWINSSAPTTSYTYGSPRGEMKVVDASSFSTDMTFNGVLPALPDAGSYNQTQLYNYVNDVYSNGPYIDSEDTYWGGKDAGRLAQLVWIADQVGHNSARDAFLNDIKTNLEDWLDADDGGAKQLYYDSTWDTLIGFPASFGTNTELNDHDFHYGYWVMAAATVANFDPGWANDSQWGGMVKLMVKDVANTDRADTMFPFLRSFDVYAGHDWANGAALFASGNNEESSSEAMNFATGLILWGAATGDTELRDLGIYIYSNMTHAIEQYWFDVDEQVFPTGFDYETVGMVWGSGGAYATWWTANPEEIHGINFLPFTGGSLYLGRNPDYITRNYNFLVGQNGGQETEWVDIIWNFQALADPAAALAKFGNGTYGVEDGESIAHTYHWLHNLNAMGQLDTAVTANTPTYAVFNKNGVRTYTAYNPGSTNLQVHFSDGQCLTVAPGQIGHGAGTSCGTPPTATPPPTGQQPYGGTAWTIPGRIEAENYDTGGQNVAYNDTTNGNSGSAYRSDNVDIQGTSDAGGGYNVGWINSGEWLEYTVNVANTGNYDLAVRVAAQNNAGTVHVEIDGVDVTGAMSFAATGGWQSWTTITAVDIPLTAGQHILRLSMDSTGFNVNWLEWSQASAPTPTELPPTATPTSPPTNTPTPPPAGTNIALNQPATQSSTAHGGVPERAVDGNTNGNWNQGSVTHTNTEPQPWWEVDLGSSQDIANIVLFNRTNSCCTHRLADFYVYVSDSSFGTRTDVAQIANDATWSTYHSGTLSGSSLDIAANTNGRYVRVQLSGSANPLSLAEVQVISGSGSPTPTPSPSPTTTPPPTGQQPYGGTAWTIPGRIEAENYDTGGQNVAYNDTTNGNSGSAYRNDNVDIEGTSDAGGGYNVGWISSGEWLEYTVNVANTGTYDLAVRVAAQNNAGTVHVEIDGVDVTGAMSFAATGGWQSWTTITAVDIPLTAGQHILRLSMDSAEFNVNWLEWSQTTTMANVPGVVTNDAGAFSQGQTKSWDVNVTQAGNYRLWITSTSGTNSRSITVVFDGRSVPISLNSGQTVLIDFANVAAGANTLQITANNTNVSLGELEFEGY